MNLYFWFSIISVVVAIFDWASYDNMIKVDKTYNKLFIFIPGYNIYRWKKFKQKLKQDVKNAN